MSGRRGRESDASSIHDPLLGLETGTRISKDRRRFIILSIFDFTLLVLLWMICTVSKGGDDVPQDFIHEINIFAPTFMHESLFDIVIVVFLRMITLIVCYGALRIAHWLPVAITTGTTSLYLIIKVLFFFSHKTGVGLPQYLLVLASFIVAWVELWFMPFRVLPRERNMMERGDGNSSDASIGRRRNGVPARPVICFSEDEFRSALDFTSDSEDDQRGNSSSAAQPKRSKASYIKAACTAELESRRLLGEVAMWRELRQTEPIVRQSPKGAFYIRSTFECTPQQLWQAVWNNNTKWNDQVLDAKDVLKVDDRTVLFYSVSAPAMRGYIASRDFLDVRRIDEEPEKNVYTGYFMSVDSHLLPPNANKKIVRGNNGPSLMKVYASPISPTHSILEWVMQTDLKGGLPKRVVLSNMLAFFVNNMTRLKHHLERQ